MLGLVGRLLRLIDLDVVRRSGDGNALLSQPGFVAFPFAEQLRHSLTSFVPAPKPLNLEKHRKRVQEVCFQKRKRFAVGSSILVFADGERMNLYARKREVDIVVAVAPGRYGRRRKTHESI